MEKTSVESTHQRKKIGAKETLMEPEELAKKHYIKTAKL